MNKKLIVLIVALECVFSIFLISVFGPMIEAMHSHVVVEDVYFVDEAGNRMEDEETIEINLDTAIEFHYDFEVVTTEATDRSVDIVHSLTDDDILIETDADGFGFTVIFMTRKVTSVRITVRATDGSQKSASITLVKRDGDQDLGDDF